MGDNAAVPHPINHSLTLNWYRTYMASARYTGELRGSTRGIVGFDVSGVFSSLAGLAEVPFGRSGEPRNEISNVVIEPVSSAKRGGGYPTATDCGISAASGTHLFAPLRKRPSSIGIELDDFHTTFFC